MLRTINKIFNEKIKEYERFLSIYNIPHNISFYKFCLFHGRKFQNPLYNPYNNYPKLNKAL